MTSVPQPTAVSGPPTLLPLAAAPMAALSHSAFRRLLGEMGGADLLYTEMLAGTRLLVEGPESPHTKRRPADGRLVYQLLLRDTRRLEAIVDRLRPYAPDGLDLNCACPAARIRDVGGGVDLFEDRPRLETILRELRRLWNGPLSAKIRLGREPAEGWQERLLDRLRLCRDLGVDSLTVHPRFGSDRLTRPARHDLLPWICAAAGVPVTANGDITGPGTVAAHPEYFAGCSGLMLGRIAIVRPWIFAAWRAGVSYPVPDAAEVWRRFVAFTLEDFPADQVVPRLRLFTGWYARNFVYGHILAGRVRHLTETTTLIRCVEAFFATAPALVRAPSLYDM